MVSAHQLDLLDPQSIKSFTSEINKKGQKIDVLINNAGITCPMGSKSYEDTQKVLRTVNNIVIAEFLWHGLAY